MYNSYFSTFNLKQVNPSVLLLPENFEAVKYQAYKVIDNLDWDGATKFEKELEEKLKSLSGNVNQKDLYYYNILRFWLLRLKLFVFRNLTDQEKTEIFKNNTVETISNNLDLKGAIFKYIDFYQYDKIIKEDAKIYITALNSSSEFLGSNISQFQQNNFRPTVSNWLKEYQIVINTLNSGNIQAGAFHIVKFMDTNKYIKYLKTDEQKNLRELLDLYNWLLNPIIYSDDEKIEQPSSYIQSQRFELPREISQPSAPKLPPVAPAPKNAPTLRPMGDMVDARIKNNELGIKEKTTFPKPQGVLQSIPTNRRVNPLPEVRPGLSMSPPANYQMPKKEIPVENVQEKIDKKLEDLEKRVK